MTDVTITFPDGKTKQIASGTTGLDVAKGISPSLAKRSARPLLSNGHQIQDSLSPSKITTTAQFIGSNC